MYACWDWYLDVVRSVIGGEAEACPFLDLQPELALNNKKQTALQVKAKLIDKARVELPSRMGRSYTEVVLSCLTCLDPGSASTFEDEDGLYDQDGIAIGVAFIEKIWYGLRIS